MTSLCKSNFESSALEECPAKPFYTFEPRTAVNCKKGLRCRCVVHAQLKCIQRRRQPRLQIRPAPFLGRNQCSVEQLLLLCRGVPWPRIHHGLQESTEKRR